MSNNTSPSTAAPAGSCRTPQGGRIDRSQTVQFRFNGETLTGYAGDTVAATLLAHGHHLVARSFKYHRPRGIMAAGIEEANALLTVGNGNTTEPNIAATVIESHNGLQTRTQNAWPSVKFDLMAVNNLLSSVFVAGFYYKTFMPSLKGWMFFEHFIRKAAGLGRADEQPDPERYDWHHGFPGVVVVGSGLVLDKLLPSMVYERGTMQIAHMVHAVATVLMMAMFLGHIYMGTIGMQGAYKAMRTGYVDETWAKEHHELWLDDIQSGKIPAQRSASPATAQPLPVRQAV